MASLRVLWSLTIVLPMNLVAGFNVDLHLLDQFANQSCPLLLVTKHYSEMSCLPGELRNATFMHCPRDYNCKSLAQRPKTHCLHHGKKYEIGEKIPSTEMRVRCKHNCVCRVDPDGFTGFQCKTRKCAPEKSGCKKTYANPFQCCPKYKCGEPEPDAFTCKYRNTTHIVGEVLDNTFNLTRCFCRKGFKGVLKAPFCQPVDCGIELEYDLYMRKGCSPVFSVDIAHFEVGKQILSSIFDFMRDRLLDLCPLRWACPSDDDVVVPLTSMAPEIPVIDTTLSCRYGNNDMAMLDLAMSPEQADGSCTMCMCLLPPNLFCMHKAVCWAF